LKPRKKYRKRNADHHDPPSATAQTEAIEKGLKEAGECKRKVRGNVQRKESSVCRNGENQGVMSQPLRKRSKYCGEMKKSQMENARFIEKKGMEEGVGWRGDSDQVEQRERATADSLAAEKACKVGGWGVGGKVPGGERTEEKKKKPRKKKEKEDRVRAERFFPPMARSSLGKTVKKKKKTNERKKMGQKKRYSEGKRSMEVQYLRNAEKGLFKRSGSRKRKKPVKNGGRRKKNIGINKRRLNSKNCERKFGGGEGAC